MRRRRSISATCFGLMAAGLRRKPLCAPRRVLIRCLRKLGTTFPICWTSRGGRKPPSIACARRYEPRRPTLMRYSISRSCFNEATSTRKLRNTGGNYIANDAQSEWAARARRSLKFCEMQIHLSAYFWGIMLWHTVSSELSLPSCLTFRWSRLPTARHRPKNVQLVRRHGHLAESSQSAKDGTTRVSKLVAGLWGL